MILIIKGSPPAGLAAGIALTAANCAAFDADPAAHRAGTKKFAFKKAVYGSSVVKSALKDMQHHKCCFCEARFAANYRGDVEHYRPKGAVRERGRKLLPGYFWLAYEWNNLFYACADCNQYQKLNHFPLMNSAMRATDHHRTLGAEEPLLLDPGGPEDPRAHIQFRRDVPTWSSAKGEQTIKTLKLDREELNLSRRTHLKALESLVNIVRFMSGDSRPEVLQLVHDARAGIAAAKQPSAVFSAASQDFLSMHGL